MRTQFNLLLLLVSFASAGCDMLTGKEVARLPINRISTSEEDLVIKEASLNLKKGEEIAFWSDMDMEYEGEIGLLFAVQVLKDGVEYTSLELDPLKTNITVGETRTEWNGKVDWSYEGKSGEMKIEEDGNYTFKAYLSALDNGTLNLKKGELVLRK